MRQARGEKECAKPLVNAIRVVRRYLAVALIHMRLVGLALAFDSGGDLLLDRPALRLRLLNFNSPCLLLGARFSVAHACQHRAALLLVLDVADVIWFTL